MHEPRGDAFYLMTLLHARQPAQLDQGLFSKLKDEPFSRPV
jgi:hypothetical protein